MDLKRILDLSLASTALILLSPAMLLLAILNRIFLGPGVIFSQQRAGWRGRPFTLYKFRSMHNTRNAFGRMLPDGLRLSTYGRFLRSTSLDELPELFNVLRGDMSLVGPRPLFVKYLARYTQQQARRHEVRPGMTGWAQVQGRNLLSWDEKFALDLWYVDHQSIWLDSRILFLTLWKVVRREGITPAGLTQTPEFLGSLEDRCES